MLPTSGEAFETASLRLPLEREHVPPAENASEPHASALSNSGPRRASSSSSWYDEAGSDAEAQAYVGEAPAHDVDLDGDPLLPPRPQQQQPQQQRQPQQQQPQAAAGWGTLPPLPARDSMREPLARMRDAWERVKRLQQPDARDDGEDESWLSTLKASLPDPAAFKAGRLREHQVVVEEYLRAAGGGHLSDNAKWLLRSIKEGFNFEWVGVHAPGQEHAPERGKKERIVRQMLRAAAPHANPDELLGGPRPHAVTFPNHRSAQQYAAFVSAEIENCKARGVLVPWNGQQPPTVVNGIRVADDPGRKKRFCINTMYPNLFMRYRPVKYEQLSDVVDYLSADDYMYTTDDKSGYWQLPLHPDTYQYLAIEWQGEVLCFTHMPFGVSPGCYIYTTVKQELFRPLRDRGVRMSFLIDDQMGAAAGLPRAKFQCRAVVDLLVSLGFVLSIEKCQLLPAQRARFLGMIVDAAQQLFEVPADKVADFARLVDQLLGGSTDARTVARVAGKMMAMSKAIATAPLHSRLVAAAAVGRASWDEVFATPQECLEQALLFQHLLQHKNGKTFWKREIGVRVAGDASETAYAAFLPDGELGNQKMHVPFTEGELTLLAAQEWSSTARELTTVLHAVRWLQVGGQEGGAYGSAGPGAKGACGEVA